MKKTVLNKTLKVGGILLLASLLCQCSKEGKEKDFDVIMQVKSPLIHLVDRTIGETEVAAPWFNLSFNVSNNTDQDVKIEDVLIYYTANGEEQEPISFDLGLLTISDEAGNTYNYVNYCTYPVGIQNQAFSACLMGFNDYVNNPTSPAPAIPEVVGLYMYLGGLTENDDKSVIYRMRVELLGVFLDSAGVETDRFTKKFYFTTR